MRYKRKMQEAGNGMKHKRRKLTGRTFGQFFYIRKRSSERKEGKRLISANISLLTAFKDIRQWIYAFNHFKASYGPAIGLYGVLKNVAEENLTRNKNENPEREGIKGLDSIRRHWGKRTEKGKGNQSRQNLIGFKGIQVSDNFWKAGKKEIEKEELKSGC